MVSSASTVPVQASSTTDAETRRLLGFISAACAASEASREESCVFVGNRREVQGTVDGGKAFVTASRAGVRPAMRKG